MKDNQDWTETITLTYKGHGHELSASWSGKPIKVSEVLEWIETHALPAIGFSLPPENN